MAQPKRLIVLFDGVCNLCESSVVFIINHDKKAHYHFVALQSQLGKSYLAKIGLETDYNESLILLKDDQYYLRSDAVLEITKQLDGLLPLLYYAIIWIPKPIRDFFYKVVSRKRYAWFGKKKTCLYPSPELQARFEIKPTD